MAEAYPWGNQSPQARLSKLDTTLKKSQAARDAHMEAHRAKIAEFDENEKRIKADIKACEAVIDKERTEAQSEKLSKILTKIATSGSVDLGALLADPNLEEKLAALAADNAKSAAKKPAKAASKSDPSDPDNAASSVAEAA